ncbi:MAG: alpha-galactosidase, partial [Planctomycetota bacterium]|nr:alpha-galactosidase [Planctomycetota bacterium]
MQGSMRAITAVTFLACGILLGAAAAAQGEVLSIRSATREGKYDTATGRLSAAAGPRAFIVDGKLSADGGAAKVVTITDKKFGECQAIEVKYPSGSGDLVFLASKSPFVFLRASLHNGGKELMVANKVPALSLGLDLGKPVESLKAFGTGGIVAPDKNPGSYMWQAVVEPQGRSGVVGGWITTRMDGRIDYGRLRLAPDKTEALETFAVGWFDDARLGMEAWADAVAKVYAIKLPPQPVGYCTWYHAGSSSEKKLPEQSAFAAANLAPFGFSVVQIDDGWQDGDPKKNGPRKNFTQVRPDGPYPSGMKATADDIKSKGLVPGIWFMPFAGTYNDPWFEKHQDWFVKKADGKPYDTSWGGTCLDPTHPGFQEYLRAEIKRIAHEWGYLYFKMDGMWTGTGTQQQYVNEGYKEDHMGDAVHHNLDKTNIEAFRDGQKLVREAAGPDVFILGCCTPQNMRSYGGTFGLVNAMRIGPDNGANWGGIQSGPIFGARNYHLHGRIWYNDPDPLYVRKSLLLSQAQAICSWVTVSGQLSMSSDAFADLPPERLEILKRTMPSHGLQARPVDLFEEKAPRIWVVADDRRQPRRDVVGLFNWSSDKKELAVERPLKDLGLSDTAEYAAFEFWSNALVPPFKGRLKFTVPPASCAVLSLRQVAEHPQLISTSRHIMQGIVDVLEEKWAADSRELSGTSKVVGSDDYELRVLTYSTK